MKTTAERLRWWIVGAGVLLVVAIGGYTVAGRLKQRILKHDLPARLGINIQQDSNGFTLSKSQAGRTLFTLHAARALQYKSGGEARLHDVSIVFYGRGEHPREDRIRGQSFSYDQTTQVVKADGEVEIDLQPPTQTNQSPEDVARNIIHLRTSGLVFEQKTGRAYTTQLTEFRLPQAEGTAVGAEYDSRDGVLQLESQVRLHTTMQDEPVTVNAAHATLRRNDVTEESGAAEAARVVKGATGKAAIEAAKPIADGKGMGEAELLDASLHSPTRDLRAGRALMWLRGDGSVDHAEFSGQVLLTTVDGSQVEAKSAQATMNSVGKIERVHAEGGVTFSQTPAVDEEERGAGKSKAAADVMEEGQAEQLWLEEDAHSQPTHLRLLGGVEIRQHPVAAPALWSRQLKAGEVNVAFAEGRAHLVTATQSPVLEETAESKNKKRGPVKKSLKAERLDILLRNGRRPESLVGTGNTEFAQSDAAETDTSRGDALTVKFDEKGNASPGASGARAGKSGQGATTDEVGQIRSAVQEGHVTLVRTTSGEKAGAGALPAAKPAGAEVTRGWAERADYEQASETVALTGSPRIEDSGSANGTLSLTAKQVVLERTSGDAVATGAVQTTQRQQAESVPTHIISTQAKLSHAQHTALFTGAARLWQGDNAIEAPVILLSQSPQGLEATSLRGERVRAAFVSRGQAPGRGPGQRRPGQRRGGTSSASGGSRSWCTAMWSGERDSHRRWC